MTGQAETLPDFVFENLTLILLVACTPVFSWLAISARKVSTFQFQISIFILIWILGELADLLHDLQVIPIQIGMQIHLASMGFFAIMLWIRFYRSLKLRKTMIENPEDSLV